MKLYDVPDHTKVRVLGRIKVPPEAPAISKGEVLSFSHIDGMYSYCHNSRGEVVHLIAWAEVEIVPECPVCKEVLTGDEIVDREVHGRC